MKWISTKDEMPEMVYEVDEWWYSNRVLITNGRHITIAKLYRAQGVTDWYCDEEIYIYFSEVTHWMVLPELPKQ